MLYIPSNSRGEHVLSDVYPSTISVIIHLWSWKHKTEDEISPRYDVRFINMYSISNSGCSTNSQGLIIWCHEWVPNGWFLAGYDFRLWEWQLGLACSRHMGVSKSYFSKQHVIPGSAWCRLQMGPGGVTVTQSKLENFTRRVPVETHHTDGHINHLLSECPLRSNSLNEMPEWFPLSLDQTQHRGAKLMSWTEWGGTQAWFSVTNLNLWTQRQYCVPPTSFPEALASV